MPIILREKPTGEPKPPQEAYLWRYMSLWKFTDLLINRRLVFSPPWALGDPLEGSIARPLVDKLVRDASREQLLETAEKIAATNLPQAPGWRSIFAYLAAHEPSDRVRAYTLMTGAFQKHWTISCWSAQEYESQALWRVFAPAEDGVAIRVKLSQLSAALDEPVSAVAVECDEWSPEIEDIIDGSAALARKHHSLAHEKELRLMKMTATSKLTSVDFKTVDIRLSEMDILVRSSPNAPTAAFINLRSLINKIEESSGPNWFRSIDIQQSATLPETIGAICPSASFAEQQRMDASRAQALEEIIKALDTDGGASLNKLRREVDLFRSASSIRLKHL